MLIFEKGSPIRGISRVFGIRSQRQRQLNPAFGDLHVVGGFAPRRRRHGDTALVEVPPLWQAAVRRRGYAGFGQIPRHGRAQVRPA